MPEQSAPQLYAGRFNKIRSSYPRGRALRYFGERAFILRTLQVLYTLRLSKTRARKVLRRSKYSRLTSRFSTFARRLALCSPPRGNSPYRLSRVRSTTAISLREPDEMRSTAFHSDRPPSLSRIHPRQLAVGEFCVQIKEVVLKARDVEASRATAGPRSSRPC